VFNVRTFLKYWLPILIWMAVIFAGSADSGSFRHSSRILGPLLHWLFPHITEEAVNRIVLVARKGAHVTEYGILGLLIWRALRRPVFRDPRPWSWRIAGWSVLLVALYAASDEFHQRFVPGREATVHDVVIDTCGASLALLLLRFVGLRLGWWKAP
jgi:VanZ family protein